MEQSFDFFFDRHSEVQCSPSKKKMQRYTHYNINIFLGQGFVKNVTQF